MWKFLRYWTGVNLIVSMPFIAPLAAALHSVFNRRDCSCPPPQRRLKKEQPVLVTRTEVPPPPAITWKRIYKRVIAPAARTAGPLVRGLRRELPVPEPAGEERPARSREPATAATLAPEKNQIRSRRRGMQR
jgi:hypothetical protein